MPIQGSSSSNQPNRFGSTHTAIKLDCLGKYIHAYTTALKNQPFKLHYFDAFAGTGYCDIQVNGSRLVIPGSAVKAIECTPPFHRLVFIEQSARKVAALSKLKLAAPSRDITIIHQDANIALPQCLSALTFEKDRAFVFLDPFGMQVEWSTLETIARTRFTDVLYLFPLSGLYRQATRSAGNIVPAKANSLTRIFGTEDWRTAFYEPPRQGSFFDQEPDQRTKDAIGMLPWVKLRLETIFSAVVDPMVLYQSRDGKQGPPIFALFFAMSNPSKKAIELGLRLAKAVLKPA